MPASVFVVVYCLYMLNNLIECAMQMSDAVNAAIRAAVRIQ